MLILICKVFDILGCSYRWLANPDLGSQPEGKQRAELSFDLKFAASGSGLRLKTAWGLHLSACSLLLNEEREWVQLDLDGGMS